jgi:hypothetical protein
MTTDDADVGVPDLTGGTIREIRGIRGFGDPRESAAPPDGTDDADYGFPDLTGGTIPEIRGIRGLVIRANPRRRRMARMTRIMVFRTSPADYP